MKQGPAATILLALLIIAYTTGVHGQMGSQLSVIIINTGRLFTVKARILVEGDRGAYAVGDTRIDLLLDGVHGHNLTDESGRIMIRAETLCNGTRISWTLVVLGERITNTYLIPLQNAGAAETGRAHGLSVRVIAVPLLLLTLLILVIALICYYYRHLRE